MNLIQTICGYLEGFKLNFKIDQEIGLEKNFSGSEKEKSQGFMEQLSPRDGMSADSAKFLIGKCANNRNYKVYGIENKGRYFTAKIQDKNGKIVNELLVDKLNGTVKFIR